MAPIDTPNSVSGQVYAAFWRWHFYAGLLIMPVLMLMALTGGLYLFRGEIDGVLYRPLVTVQARPGGATPQAWVASAIRAEGGRIVRLTPPADPGRAARLTLEIPTGQQRDVFVDPYDARILGSIPSGGVMQTVKRLHSLEVAGPVANMLAEVVAGWAVVMVITGVFLWWPRGQVGGVVTIRAMPGRRLFWRDLHAVIGIFSAMIVLFLAITGMPWTAVWGAQVRTITNAAGWGAPMPPAGRSAGHGEHQGAAPSAVPWAMEGLDMSINHEGHAPTPPPTLDGMLARIDATGLPPPYTVSIPKDPGKAWSAAHTAQRAEDSRTIYLDGATGAVTADISYDHYGPAARAIQWGIAVHQGEEFGPLNRYVMLAGCISVWLLGVSAIVMWWKRRPKGRLAPPPAPSEKRAYTALAAVVAPLGLIYPLVGASLLAVLILDIAIRRSFGTMRRGSAQP